jgi:GMP synthase PP-ATPase subunit
LVISLNAVGSLDFLAARPTRLPHKLRDVCSYRFLTEDKGLSPVVDDMSSKPSAAIE